MRGIRLLKTAQAIGLSALLVSCWLSPHFWYRARLRPDHPPETFQEGDLVGIWKTDYGRYEWERCGDNTVMRQARSLVEWLVLREDKTFYQVLQDRRGQISDQWAQGTWWVERFPDGVTRLHLEGGRFFAGAVCYSFPQLTVGGGSYSSDQTGHRLFFDRSEAIIIVGWDRFINKLYLEYPFVGSDPDAPIIVAFERVSEAEAGSVPTPQP